ncbi:hypothetical protein Tco_0886839 [Tanacetum coccineum]
MVQDVDFDFIDLDSPKDDEPIIIEDESDEEVHAEKVQSEELKETNDASATHPLFPKSIQIQELTNQVLLLQSQNQKLEKLKSKAEVEVAFLIAQPSFPNVKQLTELLVKSLKPKLSTLLTSYDFSKSLPTELKELLSKFNDLSREIKELNKYVEKLEVELPIPGQVSSFNDNIKTLDALPSLLSKVTKALDMFAQAVKQASPKASDQDVPSTGQAGTHPAEGEKNTKQATITQLVKQGAKKMV